MLKRLLIISLLSIALVAGLAVGFALPRESEAGFRSIPGGWGFTAVHCINGVSITVDVPASTTAGVQHTALLTASSPGVTAPGLILQFFGDSGTAFSGSRNFYWTTLQTPGATTSVTVDRYEDGIFAAGDTDVDTVQNCELPPPFVPLTTDGRINGDAWQTGAVYCRSGGVEVLYSNDGNENQGETALFVSYEDIDAAGVPADSPTLLGGSGDGYSLYRLSDGRFEFNAPGLEPGTTYRYLWYGCR